MKLVEVLLTKQHVGNDTAANLEITHYEDSVLVNCRVDTELHEYKH